MGGINIHVYFSDMYYESRMLKIAECLKTTRWFEAIHLVGISKEGSDAGYATYRDGIVINRINVYYPYISRVPFGRAMCFFIYLLKMFFIYIRKNVSMVNCHSVTVLPFGIIFKFIKGSIIIYDTHELESKKINVSSLMSIIYEMLEKLSYPYFDAQYVVSDHIRDYYSNMYVNGNKVFVIYNKPRCRDLFGNRHLRDELGLGEDAIVFLYLGLLSRGRGIDLLLSVFKGMEGNKHLVLIGRGAYEGKVIEAKYSCRNIHLMSPVPPDKVVDVAMLADVGLSIIENVSLSYYYSLPNKVFEYLMAGLPILVSDFPEMKSLVSRYQCGWAVKVAEKDLKDMIKGIDREKIRERKEQVLINRPHFSWEGEESKLLKYYESIINKSCAS